MAATLREKAGHAPDYAFLILALMLVVGGLLMLSSASSDLGKIKFNDTYYYLKHQLFYGLSLGIVGFFAGSVFYYRRLQKMALPLLLFSLVGLVLVFTPIGFSHGKAYRWISLGPLSLQPAEFLKLTFIIYLAAWLAAPAMKRSTMRSMDFTAGFLPFLLISGLVGLLILIQPSTTTFLIIMASGLIVYFIAGARPSYIILTILVGALCLAAVLFLTHDYRLERITTFLGTNTARDSYHLDQALITIGSGGWWGVGYGRSTAKFKFLPEPIGDSLFAVLAEELGFMGAIILILLFAAFLFRGLFIAYRSRDQFARLMTVGFMSVIGIQTIIHIAAISGIMPLTGVPLPFMSYGGTSLMVFLTMAGIVVNISRYTN